MTDKTKCVTVAWNRLTEISTQLVSVPWRGQANNGLNSKASFSSGHVALAGAS